MSLRRGIVASFADKYVSQMVQLATLAVMSRLLTPAEIGLYLVANTVILLAENFRWFGVGIYIVQVPVLRRECLRAALSAADDAIALRCTHRWDGGALVSVESE